MNSLKIIIFSFSIFLLIGVAACKEEEKPKVEAEIKETPPPKKEEVVVETVPEIVEEHHFEEAFVVPKTYHLDENPSYSISTENYNKRCATCDCGFAIEYPKVNDFVDEAVQEKVNQLIKERFLASSISCNDLQRGDVFQQKGAFKMTLVAQHIVSFYAFVETYTANKRPTERFLFSFNFDLHAGKEMTFETLFAHSSAVDKQLKRHWNKMKFNYSSQDFKSNYDFYLTPKTIVFINLMKEKGTTGDEAAIRYKYFVHEMNTNHILHELLEGEEI